MTAVSKSVRKKASPKRVEASDLARSEVSLGGLVGGLARRSRSEVSLGGLALGGGALGGRSEVSLGGTRTPNLLTDP